MTAQHGSPASHAGEHLGAMHMPQHIELGALQRTPQPPQLSGSFSSLTHTPLQHWKPAWLQGTEESGIRQRPASDGSPSSGASREASGDAASGAGAFEADAHPKSKSDASQANRMR